MISELARQTLRDPRVSLPAYAKVIGQKDEAKIAYNPFEITHNLQSTVLSYVADPPRTPHGQTRWLVMLGYRQGGKSLCSELAFYPKAAYTQGWDHVCMADKDDRAEYLHKRVHFTHNEWDPQVRAKTIPSKESLKLTFDHSWGGQMRTLSAQEGSAGIGQSISSFHGSEVPFWPNAGEVFTLLFPSQINRDNAYFLLESTPAPLDADSVEWWKDTCIEAKRGVARYLYAFFPFWDGKLNTRPWNPTDTLTNEEIRLLDKYGKFGLTLDNLAFRRLMLETDREIRRNPDLFSIYYPFDDLSCWLATAKGVLHASVLERHVNAETVPWKAPYMEYEEPEADAIYVIGADAAGFGIRDHASFQVLKVYKNSWKQVACYADNEVDPVSFTKKLYDAGMRYNKALIVVESNGVGTAPLAMLLDRGYPNLYFEAAGKPGKTSTGKSVDEMLGFLVDALKDDLLLVDSDTILQLQSYKNDKRIEFGVVTEMLVGHHGRRRRERHHWDKVSALTMAVVGARDLPQRKAPKEETFDNVIPLFGQMSAAQQDAYRNELAKSIEKYAKRGRATRYRPMRRFGR